MREGTLAIHTNQTSPLNTRRRIACSVPGPLRVSLILLAAGAILALTTNARLMASGKSRPEDQIAIGETSLSYRHALLLGLVEGITEFLPISSTGHLILVNAWAFPTQPEPLPSEDRDRATGWAEAGQDNAPITLSRKAKTALDAYIIVIQAGAIAAVLIIYRGRVKSILFGLLGKDRHGLKLGRNLAVAFLPAVIVGLSLENLIEELLFHPMPVALALFGGGLLMLGVEQWRKRSVSASAVSRDLQDLSIAQSLVIGLIQCIALWPGMSRSMSAIVGGYLAGLSPPRAAEFSFLLGLPTLTGAALYKAFKAGPEMLTGLGWGPILVGCLAAAVAAAVSVRGLVFYLNRHGLAVFAIYRIFLAALVLWALG